jgi:CubicO group peptidase (beta-lactamase class C family)
MTTLNQPSLIAWLDERAAQGLFSGVVLVRSGGETLLEHAAGLAHRGHRIGATPETKFQVASVGKTITATTALRLVESGALSLEKPLTSFLPPELRPAGLDDRHTLHHLLSHTSGLADYHDGDDETWASFTSAWDRVPVYKARGPRDLLPLFADLPPVSDPGEYDYCDANFVLIGLLIEWITDKSFASVATSEVLVPAAMADSGFFQLDDEPEDMATGYLVADDTSKSQRSNIYSVPAGGMPDGGIITTAADIDRFLDALRSGMLLAPETFSQMVTPHAFEDDGPEAYGYGMELVVVDDIATIFGHGGSDPGVSAMVSHYVGAGTTVVVLCNQDRGSWAVAQRMARELGLDDPRD